jgi:predicted O-methyltransferase YrrM
MSSLEDLVNNSVCDLNTTHSYLQTYDNLFSNIRDTPLNILQIGVLHGGAMQLWDSYFSNATIYGVDTQPMDVYRVPFFKQSNVKLYSAQPYEPAFVETNFVDQNITFDIIFDDANPRNFDTQSAALTLYRPLLKPNGILIIEDLEDIGFIERLDAQLPSELLVNRTFYDLRKNKGRYDDILYVYTNTPAAPAPTPAPAPAPTPAPAPAPGP